MTTQHDHATELYIGLAITQIDRLTFNLSHKPPEQRYLTRMRASLVVVTCLAGLASQTFASASTTPNLSATVPMEWAAHTVLPILPTGTTTAPSTATTLSRLTKRTPGAVHICNNHNLPNRASTTRYLSMSVSPWNQGFSTRTSAFGQIQVPRAGSSCELPVTMVVCTSGSRLTVSGMWLAT